MDFNFITAVDADAAKAMIAVRQLFFNEFSGTKTKFHSAQFLATLVPGKIVGSPPQSMMMCIVTVVNEYGEVVSNSEIARRNGDGGKTEMKSV
jgi:hypothetical protein